LNPNLPPDVLLAQGIEANVRWTIKQIRSSPEGKARVKEGRIKLVGAIYQIQTGRVWFLR
jgi:carbonic anhydrase